MAAALVHTSVAQSGASATSSFNFSITPTTAGNVLVLYVATITNVNFLSFDTGSTIVAQANAAATSNGASLGLGWIAPSVISALTLTADNNTYWAVIVEEWSGVSTGSPIDAFTFPGYVSLAGGSTITLPGISPSQTGDPFIVFGSMLNGLGGSESLANNQSISLAGTTENNTLAPAPFHIILGAGVYSGGSTVVGSYVTAGTGGTTFAAAAAVLLNPGGGGSVGDRVAQSGIEVAYTPNPIVLGDKVAQSGIEVAYVPGGSGGGQDQVAQSGIEVAYVPAKQTQCETLSFQDSSCC